MKIVSKLDLNTDLIVVEGKGRANSGREHRIHITPSDGSTENISKIFADYNVTTIRIESFDKDKYFSNIRTFRETRYYFSNLFLFVSGAVLGFIGSMIPSVFWALFGFIVGQSGNVAPGFVQMSGLNTLIAMLAVVVTALIVGALAFSAMFKFERLRHKVAIFTAAGLLATEACLLVSRIM